MKVLVALYAVAACAVAAPYAGFVYSAPALISFPFAVYTTPNTYYVHPALVTAPVGVKPQYFAEDIADQISNRCLEPCQSQNVLQNTPEVAEAKATFFSEVGEAKSRPKRRVPVQIRPRPTPQSVPAVTNTAPPTSAGPVIAPSSGYSRPSEFSVVYGK